MASEVFGVAPDDVTSEMRQQAKAVNFGVIYGQTGFGLSKQLGISQTDAQAFIDSYFKKYSCIKEYLESILDRCIADGFVSTLLGRRRSFVRTAIREIRKGGLTQSERMAINTVIQGSAADLMKQAMVELHRERESLPGFSEGHVQLLLQIHDELVFETQSENAEDLRDFVTKMMVLDQPLRVPLVVDADISEHW